MRKKENYKVEDFVNDLEFRKWVLNNTPKLNTKWEDWLAVNPHKRAIVDEAKSLVIATQVIDIELTENIVNEGINAILDATENTSKNQIFKYSISIAASVLLLICFGWIFLGSNIFNFRNDTANVNSDKTITTVQNNESLTLQLSDGTKVVLKKGSTLNVANDFGKQTRTVELIGEAFFEVKKDPLHPFLVYGGGVVTRVLGTSFNVRAYKNEERTVITVSKGQVTVYHEENGKTGIQNNPGQILLTPNQQVVFEKSKEKLVKSLVAKPMMLNSESSEKVSEYIETPIPKIFDQLEIKYGVKIVYDADLLANCNLTATFAKEPFFEKIDIICETIKAKYEIADGQVVVYSKGCN